ncbi:MAG: hypothetical protein ACRDP9_10145 [Kribbellaceae bacterium]
MTSQRSELTGTNPTYNTNTADPVDRYGAVGLAGVLSGNSQRHDVRALLEVIGVNGELKVVALGRRVDGSSSQTFAAEQDWTEVLPPGKWVFLAATPTDPRGIKIGGSYPQNNRENNVCDCRMDSLMFLDRVVTPGEVLAQYLLSR